MTRITACIVDLDGTMLDTLGDFEVALNATLAALGRPPLARAQIAMIVGKGSEHLIEQALARTRPAGPAIDAEADAALRRAAWPLYQRAYATINGRHAAPRPGAAEGLAALSAAGLRLACLTNKPLEFARPLLAAHGLAPFFAHVFGGDSFARKKPDPLPMIETCRALGTAPAETLAIGDSENDAAAARAAGCPVALVRGGYNHGRPIEAVAADAHLPDIAAVAAWLAAPARHNGPPPAG